MSDRFQDILDNISVLQECVDSYYPDKTQKEKNLIVLRLIRQLRESYDNSYWNMFGGKYDEKIIRSLLRKHRSGYSLYFFGDGMPGEYLFDPATNKRVDFKHLVATLSVNIHLKSYNYLNDLAGWAGDLHTCIGDFQKQYSIGLGVYRREDFDRYAKNMIGADWYSFPEEDILADIDAYNISVKMKRYPDFPLVQILKNYYLNEADKRFLLFLNTYSYVEKESGQIKAIDQRIKELTDLEKVNIRPLNDILEQHKIRDYTQEELTALGDAFFQYIYYNARNELAQPDYGYISIISNTSVEASWGFNGNSAGTLYQAAVFDRQGRIVDQSLWTEDLSTRLSGLQPFRLYNIKVRAKAKYFDTIISDWYEIGEVSTGLQFYRYNDNIDKKMNQSYLNR